MLEKFKHVFLVLGVTLCMNATVDHELVKLVREHVTQLSADVYTMKFENQEYKGKLALELKNMEQHLKIRIEKLELALDVLQREQMSAAFKVDELTTGQNLLQLHQSSLSANVNVVQREVDVLHQEQSSTAVKVDNLATNQDVLQHQVDTLHQEHSCTAVKVDNLATNQDVLQHEMGTLHQEHSCTAVKVDNLATNQDVLQHEMDTLHKEQSSTAVKLDQLQSSHKASLQRVTDLESQNNCSVPVTISYGKYKLHIILPC